MGPESPQKPGEATAGVALQGLRGSSMPRAEEQLAAE